MKKTTKQTKVLCTLGPATDAHRILERMITAGMDVARFNMSHGDQASHEQRISLMREAARQAGRPVGVLVDLQGPKLRLGNLAGGELTLKKGQTVQLGGRGPVQDTIWLPTPFRRLAAELVRGDTILLADGALELQTWKIDGAAVIAHVAVGGTIKSHQGINLPGRTLSVSSFTAKDKHDLEFAVRHAADFVALSFVRTPDDVKRVKSAIWRNGGKQPVVAKIEKPQALDEIDNIIDVAEGIMVARGDLGIELSVEEVPAAQKTIIRKCKAAEKWVIVATQMLETMIDHPSPTRAEASDVANAVYDGADCVMLSAETSIGQYPVKAVDMMARICSAAERDTGLATPSGYPARADGRGRPSVGHAVIDAALLLLAKSEASALWVFTLSGKTALLISKHRPSKPVFAFTPHTETLGYMSGLWGIEPIHVPLVKTTEEMIAAGEQTLGERGMTKSDERVIVLAGRALTPGATHMIKVHRLT